MAENSLPKLMWRDIFVQNFEWN